MPVVVVSIEGLAVFVARGFARLQELLDPPRFEQLLRDAAGVNTGANFFGNNPNLFGALNNAAQAAGALSGLSDNVEGATDDAEIVASGALLTTAIASLLGELGTVRTQLQLAVVPSGTPQQRLQQFASGFEQFIAGLSLQKRWNDLMPHLSSVLSLVGLVDEKVTLSTTVPGRVEFERDELHLERFSTILSDPLGHLGAVAGWGGSLSFEPGQKLFDKLENAFLNIGFGTLRVDLGTGLELRSPKVSVQKASGSSLLVKIGVPIPDGFNVTVPRAPGVEIAFRSEGSFPSGLPFTIDPPFGFSVSGTPLSFSTALDARLFSSTGGPLRLLGVTGGSGLQVDRFVLSLGLDMVPTGTSSSGEPFASIALEGCKAVVDLSTGDGFLRSLTGGKRLEANFEASARFTVGNGLKFDAGATLAIRVPLHINFAGMELSNLDIGFPIGASDRPGLPLDVATALSTTFGPFAMVVDGVGLELDLTFGSGNLGIANIAPGFKFPTGIGLSLDGPGGVTGGGFLSFDKNLGRYSGSVELQVFGVGVKAFGLVETKFPDGRDGFSFVIVIAAEFTPMQIGFGFTLNGVGGLLALNRSLVVDALSDAIRNGSVAHLLFPHDPIRDAPSILNDLETIFPATNNHQIVGPMAKLGWGTPTLITAELGIVIELPGPRIAVVGVAQTALPTREIALVELNLAIGGVLDFPKRLFSLDASLYDSRVGSFSVSGDAAFRMSFGDRPNFVFSIGGFNPSFAAPPNFPRLRRASVDLGVNGNPSLTLSGYFALTSNTAQIGAAIRLYASGAGIELEGHVSFDALFVFSPFSFEADLDAGMRVSFHGVGIGIHFHGHLKGPSPWSVSGEVCVSVLFWDACLNVSATFGESERVSLPTIDPWDADGAPPGLAIIGLREAVEDARNWSGTPPPSAFSVVSLAENASDTPPIDPLGSATLRQKVVPLNQKLTRFGAFKPKTHDEFTRGEVRVGEGDPIDDITAVTDSFARDTFEALSAAERLSAPPYEEMEAGFTLDPEIIHIGGVKAKQVEFQTELINGDVEVGAALYALTQRHLRAMLLKSAAGLSGVRRSGLLKYVDPTVGVKVRLPPERFVVADACALTRNLDVTASPTTHIQASLALGDHLLTHPEDIGRFAIVPGYELGL